MGSRYAEPLPLVLIPQLSSLAGVDIKLISWIVTKVAVEVAQAYMQANQMANLLSKFEAHSTLVP